MRSMKNGLFLTLFCLLPLSSWAKYQVCSITINSADEIESFREFLPEDQFEFIELLPSPQNRNQDQDSHWFNRACESKYHCDILVISGHFGGTFFGESGYTLPTELMEEKSCRQSCPGILSKAKEIFLFGCNTLANKKKDSRTYTEYLEVLLNDGMLRETAERVVAARYSPLESPFYARMNFIFSGSHTIYGFDELSPLGRHIREPLRKYFQAIDQKFGSYAQYLDSKAYKRERNTELFKPLSYTSLNQARISVSEESEGAEEFFRNKCLLYNDQSSFLDQMQAMEAMFLSEKSGSAFFAIDHFLTQNKEKLDRGQGRLLFRSIKNNPDFSEEFLSYYEHLDHLPHIKILYLNLLEKLQWMDPVELHILRKENLLKIISPPSREAYISVWLLLQQQQIRPQQFYLSRQDLPEDYVDSFWGLLIFEKLRFIAPEWQESIFSHCEDSLESQPGLCHQGLNSLAHIGPEPEIARKALKLLDYPDASLNFYSLRVLGQSGLSDYKIHSKMSEFLDSPDFSLVKEAVEALGFLKSPYSDIQEKLIQLLMHAEEEFSLDILWALNQTPIKSQEAQSQLAKYLSQEGLSPELFERGFKVFQNFRYFSSSGLYVFYDILEQGEENPLFFPVLEALSKNPNLKDIGIHYRFLLFQQAESVEFRRKALQKMEGMTWLNPEVQVPFLNYFRDPDFEVRQAAFRVLRQVKNLQPKTKKAIQAMIEEEGIRELEPLLLGSTQ